MTSTSFPKNVLNDTGCSSVQLSGQIHKPTGWYVNDEKNMSSRNLLKKMQKGREQAVPERLHPWRIEVQRGALVNAAERIPEISIVEEHAHPLVGVSPSVFIENLVNLHAALLIH